MADEVHERVRRARSIIIGFACNQAFIYALFYLGAHRTANISAQPWARLDLMFVLLCMIVGFTAVRFSGRNRTTPLFGGMYLMLCALLPLIALICRFCFGITAATLVIDGICCGFPAGVMLCAWGRIMGKSPIEQSVPEVFIASALGAVTSFLLGVVPIEGFSDIACVLLLASFTFLRMVMGDDVSHAFAKPHNNAEENAEGGRPRSAADVAEGLTATTSPSALSDAAFNLSGRILVGTCAFGVAAGLVETVGANEPIAFAPQATFMLLIFVLYCLAALQLFGGKPVINVRAILPKREESSAAVSAKAAGPLDGAYRLAILLMMSGFLLVPSLQSFGLPEESIVLAGYLGLSSVLISLFLIMGFLSGRDASGSFARGFSALFAGEVFGIMAGNMIADLPMEASVVIMVACAGIVVLVGYLYLFSEHDLRTLSLVVEDSNRFDEACELIAKQAALSKREAEILPYVLRGRTSERIASELFISKNTVDTHIRRIFSKCDVHSRQELIDLGERTERDLRRSAQ